MRTQASRICSIVWGFSSGCGLYVGMKSDAFQFPLERDNVFAPPQTDPPKDGGKKPRDR